MSASFTPDVAGPLLAGLVEAQRRDSDAVEYPAIQHVAETLIDHAQALQAVVWPVGEAAERVSGAAMLLAEGDLTVGAWNSRLDGERVVLFAVAGTTPLSLAAAATQVRSMGAAEVHACGVDVVGGEDSDAWESFAKLTVSDRQLGALVD